MSKRVVIFGAIILSVILMGIGAMSMTVWRDHQKTVLYPSVVSDPLIFSAMDLSEGVLIDLREKEDYQSGHIPGAFNLYYNAKAKDAKVLVAYLRDNDYDKTPIYVMCYSGQRSAHVFNALVNEGFQSVHYITFGYDAYKEAMGSSYVEAMGKCPCDEE